VSNDAAPPDEPRRRAEDVYEEVKQLREELPDIVSCQVERKLASGEFLLPDGNDPMSLLEDHKTITEDHKIIKAQVTSNSTALDKVEELGERLLVAIDGPETIHLDGTRTRDYEKGMAYKTNALYDGVNGGTPIRTKRERSAGEWGLWAATVAGLFSLAAALVAAAFGA